MKEIKWEKKEKKCEETDNNNKEKKEKTFHERFDGQFNSEDFLMLYINTMSVFL